MTRPVPHLLCVGLGYCARVVAKRLSNAGWRISGTARTAEGVSAIEAEGWTGLRLDGVSPCPELGLVLPAVSHVLLSVPPDRAGDPVLRVHAAQFRAAGRLAWIGYLSTVGIYGDHGGAWVDETTPAAPRTDRGRWRLAAEQAWLGSGDDNGARVEVFRLPGIYGPGRSALDSLRAGTARRIVKPGQVFNRIHVADIATALVAAMQRVGPAPDLPAMPSPHRLYNLTDDEPAPPDEVVAYAAGLLGLPVPPAVPFDTADLSPMARSFYGESKRVANTRMKQDLAISLTYPTYREGLAAIAASST